MTSFDDPLYAFLAIKVPSLINFQEAYFTSLH